MYKLNISKEEPTTLFFIAYKENVAAPVASGTIVAIDNKEFQKKLKGHLKGHDGKFEFDIMNQGETHTLTKFEGEAKNGLVEFTSEVFLSEAEEAKGE